MIPGDQTTHLELDPYSRVDWVPNPSWSFGTCNFVYERPWWDKCFGDIDNHACLDSRIRALLLFVYLFLLSLSIAFW